MHIRQGDVLHCQIDWTLITKRTTVWKHLENYYMVVENLWIDAFRCNNPFNFRHVSQNINDSKSTVASIIIEVKHGERKSCARVCVCVLDARYCFVIER